MAGEDVQDQRGAIEDLHTIAQGLFQLALLAWRQLVVEDDDIEAQVVAQFLQLLDLALADEGGRIDACKPLRGAAHDLHIGCPGQLGQLVEGVLQMPR